MHLLCKDSVWGVKNHMFKIRRALHRGYTHSSWLESYHSFSFGHFNDPSWPPFHGLTVLNDDLIQPGQGFAPHAHREIEIFTLVLKGTVSHQDSLGNTTLLHAGHCQYISAGTGVRHSEHNASSDEVAHMIQVWMTPTQNDHAPLYAQKHTGLSTYEDKWVLIASPSGEKESMKTRHPSKLYVSHLQRSKELTHHFEAGRKGYLYMIDGEATVENMVLHAGDGLAIEDEASVTLHALSKPPLMILFEL